LPLVNCATCGVRSSGRWQQLNPDRLSYRVMFADTTLHEEGKKTARDFILGRASG